MRWLDKERIGAIGPYYAGLGLFGAGYALWAHHALGWVILAVMVVFLANSLRR
jgi:hypothetical protein